MKKPTVEYQWEAYYQETGEVFKRGPVRDNIEKVSKYAVELMDEIADLGDGSYVNKKRRLASYWKGAEIRVLTRTISPWVEMEDW